MEDVLMFEESIQNFECNMKEYLLLGEILEKDLCIWWRRKCMDMVLTWEYNYNQ